MADAQQAAQERWQKLSELFDRALELARHEQSLWVDRCCGEDRAMAEELKKMLAAFHTSGLLDVAPHPLPDFDAPVAERLRAALAGRYRLEEEIGRGGMGAVYRAHELKHQRDVILKVLHPDIGFGAGRQRFEAEVQIAAKLAHPHIIPLLDSGDAGGLLYFVMPRIPGETLRARMDRVGSFAVPDALRLLRDIADALQHAHESGVVHRDLKPENVLCSGDHAFLLDFGIAQFTRDTPNDDRLTRDGHAVGTPRYMAPEQAAGRAVDHRADLYAWGLVASELLLGPRGSELDLGTARSDVPAPLVSLIYKCLAPEPAHRPRSAGVLVAALDAIQAGGPTAEGDDPALPAAGARRRLPWGAVAASLLLAVTAAVAWLLVRPDDTVRPGDLRMPIAVVPFRDESPDTGVSVRGRLAAAWITQGLHEAGLFQVIPWSDVLQAVADTRDPAAALRERLRAQTLVSGVFYETAETLTLHAEVRDTRRGVLLASLEPVSVPRDSLTQAIRLVRDRVLGALAAKRDARFAAVAPALERPPLFEAYRAFDRALEQFNAQRYRESLEGFRAAFALDSGFIPPLVYAGQAAWNTGQLALLDSLLGTLDARRGELTDYHDHLRVFLRAQLNGEGVAAHAAAAKAAALAPDSRAAYDAALLALRLGRPQEARARLEAMSPDRGAMIGWPSYWTNLTHARHLTGDHPGELRAAREMRRRHPGVRVAWTLEARALAAIHDTRTLDSLLIAADSLDAETYWSQGSMLVVAAEELAAHGDTVTALRYYRRADGWTQARLDLHRDHSAHLFWRGLTLYGLGRFAEARDVLRRRAGLSGDSDDLELAALADARAGTPNALDRLAAPSPQERAGRSVLAARLAAANGDVRIAQARMQDALRLGYRTWPWLHGSAWRDLHVALLREPALAALVGMPGG